MVEIEKHVNDLLLAVRLFIHFRYMYNIITFRHHVALNIFQNCFLLVVHNVRIYLWLIYPFILTQKEYGFSDLYFTNFV